MTPVSNKLLTNSELNANYSLSDDPSCFDFLLNRDISTNEIYIKIKGLRKQIFSHFLQPNATIEHKFYTSAQMTLELCKKAFLSAPHVYIEICIIETLLQEQNNLKAAYDRIRKQIISLQFIEPKNLPDEKKFGPDRIHEIFSAVCQKEKSLWKAKMVPTDTNSMNRVTQRLSASASLKEFAENIGEWALLFLSDLYRTTINQALENALAKAEPKFLMGNFEGFTSCLPSLEIGDSFDDLSHALFDKYQEKKQEEAEKKHNDFYCPIGLYLMGDPVVAEDGFTYERKEISRHLAINKNKSKNK